MKKAVWMAALVLLCVPTIAREQVVVDRDNMMGLHERKRPTVGLVMGGGGAKGAAHIGVLKYLEEVGIPVDYITGTSIGSIIGGFYALGYSADELDTLIRNMDWSVYMSNSVGRDNLSLEARNDADRFVLSVPFNTGRFHDKYIKSLVASLPNGFISGNKLINLFNSLSVNYIDSMDFRQLPIPFACVATDIINGDSVVFHSGSLPIAIRSSMAIPGVFSPMYVDGHVLMDGGLVDNFPVDVCRNMGADLIIGIDLSDPQQTDYTSLQSLPQLFAHLIDISVVNDIETRRPKCDLYLHPDITGYNMLSFSSDNIDTLIRRGYEMARAHHDELMALKACLEEYGIPTQHYGAPKAKTFGKQNVILSRITYRGISDEDAAWLSSHDHLFEEQMVNKDYIDNVVNEIEGSGHFTAITYALHVTGHTQGHDICDLDITLRPTEPHDFAVGVRMDSEESTSLLLHLGYNQHRVSGWKYMVEGKINQNPVFRLSAAHSINPRFAAQMSYQWNASTFKLGHTFSSVYYNTSIGHHNLALSLNRTTSRYNSLSFGLEEDIVVLDPHLEIINNLYENLLNVFSNPGHTGLFLNYHYDNLDDGYFPTRGTQLDIGLHQRLSNYGIYNSLKYSDSTFYYGFGDLRFHWLHVFAIKPNISLIVQTYNRLVIGQYDEYSSGLYDNYVGSALAGRYVEQQMPFIGLGTTQQVNNLTHIIRGDVRWNVKGRHYLTLITNYLMSSKDLHSYFDTAKDYHDSFGVGVRYSYKTAITGPLSFELNWNTLTHQLDYYLNIGFVF